MSPAHTYAAPTDYTVIADNVTVTGGTGPGKGFVKRTILPPPGPLFIMSGIGNSVFDLATTVARVRIVGTFPGATSKFVVKIGILTVVDETIGTSHVPPTSDGIYVSSGGVVQITNSSGVVWSFTEVR